MLNFESAFPSFIFTFWRCNFHIRVESTSILNRISVDVAVSASAIFFCNLRYQQMWL